MSNLEYLLTLYHKNYLCKYQCVSTLDGFLSMNGLRLVWFVNAEKSVHADGYMISNSSSWEGLFLYNDGIIEGSIYKTE